MTKSRGIGRGGSRPGAGRKPKVPDQDSIAPRKAIVTTNLVALKPDGSLDYSQTALNVLLEEMLSGNKEASRVTAARDILRHQRDVDPLGYIKARADAKKRNADVGPESTPPEQPDLIEDQLRKLLN